MKFIIAISVFTLLSALYIAFFYALKKILRDETIYPSIAEDPVQFQHRLIELEREAESCPFPSDDMSLLALATRLHHVEMSVARLEQRKWL